MRKRKFDLVRLSGAMLVDEPKTSVLGSDASILQRYQPEMFCVHFYYNGRFRTGVNRAIACFCTRRTIVNVLTDMLNSNEMNERVKKFCGFELVESGDGETTLVAHRDRLLYLLHNKFVFQ
ncbi:ORF65 [Lymantria xylina nucleopolyhedrovirus]|uniref:ORF65 n=1 Tax=Lymantria xylina multiple nucleopolyhedrovirus TaxID=2847840 RepID=D4N2A2_9ABAC|nr:ORF65 [Lymantria xylina nucleopolyhedrovirus]ADD73774.1 ORF65 [Lymantria xylina nucleopolyhedrovirus]